MQTALPQRYMDEIRKAQAEFERDGTNAHQWTKFAPIPLKKAVAREKEGWGGKDGGSAI